MRWSGSTPPTSWSDADMSEACRGLLVTAVARDRRQVASDLVALTKPRVVIMVVVTTLVGYDAGLPGSPDYVRMVHLLIGTLLAAGGTLALNQYWERGVDARMERTRNRPLPDGRLQPLEALLFGAVLTILGVAYLAALVGVAVALLTAATAILYLFVYTPLKLRTALCTLVGAVPGALPPVTGWVAARDDVTIGAWVLFAILFLWQLPHTLAIARLYREDYARAGVRVLPVTPPPECGSGSSLEILHGVLHCSLDAARRHGGSLAFFSQGQDSVRVPASRPDRHKTEGSEWEGQHGIVVQGVAQGGGGYRGSRESALAPGRARRRPARAVEERGVGARGVDRVRSHLAWTAVRSGARGRACAVEESEAAGRGARRAAGAAGSGCVHTGHAGLGSGGTAGEG